MAKKTKVFNNVKFPPEAIQQAFELFLKSGPEEGPGNKIISKIHQIQFEDEKDFFKSYSKQVSEAEYFVRLRNGNTFALKYYKPDQTSVSVFLKEESQCQDILDFLEKNGRRAEAILYR